MKTNIPEPVSISDWNYKEIIYRCRKCKTEFRFFGELEKYCHNCGNKQNWEGVILELPNPVPEIWEDRQRKVTILNEIENHNLKKLK